MLLIPAIDLRDGRCVRLLRGDFDAETRYDVEPLDLLERYRRAGAPWLHVVDLDGARDGAPRNHRAIAALASAQGPRLQIGGGLRDADAIGAMLARGASRVVIGSAAVEAPEETARWLARFGADSIVLAFDIRHDEKGVPRCVTRGWRERTALSLWDALDRYAASGVRHVLCTDVERDGAMTGPALALYREAVQRHPGIAWQASGGVRDADDLDALASAGVAAAISGRALLEHRMGDGELQSFWRDA